MARSATTSFCTLHHQHWRSKGLPCRTGRLYTLLFLGMLRRHYEAIASCILKRLPEEGGIDREHPAGRVMTGSTTRGWSWASRLLEVFSASTGTKGDIGRLIRSGQVALAG